MASGKRYTNKDCSYEQKRWASDAALHGHYFRRMLSAPTEYARHYCETRLAEIEARWAQYFKSGASHDR
jgi:hypothetical protein